MSLSDEAKKHAQKNVGDARQEALERNAAAGDETARATLANEQRPPVTRGPGTAPGGRNVETVEPTWEEDGIVHNEETWEALPSIDYTGSGIPETPAGAPLAQAWAAVMAEVQEIRKDGRFNGGGASYVYRGVDAVVNSVGPALRKHRVMILPIQMQPTYRDVNVGSKGTPMRECTMTVTYKIMGTTDESWIVVGQGESLDSGDKGTTKAGTVAFRNMLLTALAVPVDNPRLDADAQEYRRGQQKPTGLPSPVSLRDEALRPDVSYDRLNQVYLDVDPRNDNAKFPQLGQAIIVNEEGNEEKLVHLFWRKRGEHPDRPKAEEGK